MKNTELDELRKAHDWALRALGRRDHSTGELRRKLEERGFGEAAVAGVIGRLTEAGYLDDRRFALRWAESAVRNGRGYGPRLRLELGRRGVDGEIIVDVMAEIGAGHEEDATLAALVSRKFAGFDPGAATEQERRRVMNYLLRRGFSTAAVMRLWRGER